MLSKTAICLVCGLALIAFAIFAAVAFESDRSFQNMGIVGASAKMEFAFTWTLRLAGTLIAIVAAVHLVRLAGQRDGADHMVLGGVALLGGLVLLNQHWVVVTAFAALMVGLIVQQLILRSAPARAAPPESPGGSKFSPRQGEAVTGIQAERGS